MWKSWPAIGKEHEIEAGNRNAFIKYRGKLDYFKGDRKGYDQLANIPITTISPNDRAVLDNKNQRFVNSGKKSAYIFRRMKKY